MEEQVEQEQEDYESVPADEPDEDEPDEEEPETEPETEPEALAPIGPDEIKKAERAIEAQRKRLASILGESYVEHDCPLCSSLGFLPELPPPGTEFALLEAEDGSPAIVAKPPISDELKHAQDKDTCPECDGFGQVISGSKNPMAIVVGCGRCQGNGWVMVARPEASPLPSESPPGVAAVAEVAGISPVGNDSWGRPAGHKHWGVPPAMISG